MQTASPSLLCEVTHSMLDPYQSTDGSDTNFETGQLEAMARKLTCGKVAKVRIALGLINS